MSETLNTFIGVVHSQSNAPCSFEFIDFHFLLGPIVGLEQNLKCAWLFHHEISSFVLVTEGVPSDNDGFFPSGNEPRDIFYDDGFSEDCAVENIPDGTVGTLPHTFEIELFDAGFIGGDGGALDADLALLDGVGCFDGDLVVGGVPILNAQIEIEDVEIQEGGD